MISEDTATFQVLVWFLYFVLGTSLLWRSTVTFTYLKVKSAKCAFVYFRWSWSCSFGLGLGFTCSGLGLGRVILVVVLRIGLVYITARPPSWWGLLPLPKNPTPLSASIFGPSGLIWQHLSAAFISSMHRGLDKTLITHFRSRRMHQNAGFCIKIYKKIRGSPRRKGRHLFAPTRAPSASSRLATALTVE